MGVLDVETSSTTWLGLCWNNPEFGNTKWTDPDMFHIASFHSNSDFRKWFGIFPSGQDCNLNRKGTSTGNGGYVRLLGHVMSLAEHNITCHYTDKHVAPMASNEPLKSDRRKRFRVERQTPSVVCFNAFYDLCAHKPIPVRKNCGVKEVNSQVDLYSKRIGHLKNKNKAGSAWMPAKHEQKRGIPSRLAL